MKKIVTITAIAILVAAIGVIAWLFASERLVFANPNAGVGAVAPKPVCDTNLVAKYNDAMFFIGREGSDEPTLDEEGIQAVKKEITSKNNYKTDPTCQTVLFWIAVHESDYEAAKTAYEAVKELHNKNHFADSNIRANAALFTYEATVESLLPEPKNQGDIGA